MLAFDHIMAEITFCLLLSLAFAIWVLRAVRRKRQLVRLPLGGGALLVGVASGLLLLLYGCAALSHDTIASTPVYSPDRKHAVVIRDFDGGPLSMGATSIQLYSYYGLRQDEIEAGEWKLFEAKNVQWISNSELVLRYKKTPYTTVPSCQQASGVRVSCVAMQ